MPVDRDIGANSYDEAGERMLSKLWSEDAQGISLEEFHRRIVATRGRQGTLLNEKPARLHAD